MSEVELEVARAKKRGMKAKKEKKEIEERINGGDRRREEIRRRQLRRFFYGKTEICGFIDQIQPIKGLCAPMSLLVLIIRIVRLSKKQTKGERVRMYACNGVKGMDGWMDG